MYITLLTTGIAFLFFMVLALDPSLALESSYFGNGVYGLIFLSCISRFFLFYRYIHSTVIQSKIINQKWGWGWGVRLCLDIVVSLAFCYFFGKPGLSVWIKLRTFTGLNSSCALLDFTNVLWDNSPYLIVFKHFTELQAHNLVNTRFLELGLTPGFFEAANLDYGLRKNQLAELLVQGDIKQANQYFLDFFDSLSRHLASLTVQSSVPLPDVIRNSVVSGSFWSAHPYLVTGVLVFAALITGIGIYRYFIYTPDVTRSYSSSSSCFEQDMKKWLGLTTEKKFISDAELLGEVGYKEPAGTGSPRFVFKEPPGFVIKESTGTFVNKRASSALPDKTAGVSAMDIRVKETKVLLAQKAGVLGNSPVLERRGQGCSVLQRVESDYLSLGRTKSAKVEGKVGLTKPNVETKPDTGVSLIREIPQESKCESKVESKVEVKAGVPSQEVDAARVSRRVKKITGRIFDDMFDLW